MTRFDPYAAEGAATRMMLGAVVALFALCWMASAPARGAERCGSGDPRVLAQSPAGRIAFGDRARMVTLGATCGPIAPAVRRAAARSRFFLVVEDLRATTQPGAIFDISLAPPDGRPARHTRMLGTLNFFNAHPAAAGKGRRVSYEVTEALKGLAAHDRLSSGVVLAIAPMSAPDRGSDASAGSIRLVMQTP